MRGRAILAASLTLVSASALGQSLQYDWTPDTRTGCQVWSSRQAGNGALVWYGACQDGLAQDAGIRQWFQGELHADEVSNHVATTLVVSGHGVATWVNGDRYDGEWRDGSMSGYGVAILASGDRYDGEWRDSKKDGRGTQIDADGSRYDGEWQNGLPNGVGTMELANGDSYSGVWVNGCYRNGSRRAVFGADKSSCQ